MKKIYFTFLMFLFISCSTFAIDWIEIKSENGKIIELDKDSIQEKDKYYFYNVKFKNDAGDTIITFQAQKSHPFCQRIRYYKTVEYQQLNGDYENITTNLTNQLEPVSYKSQAFAAYKMVHKLMNENNKPEITF